ncbi:hypothetical protein EDC01DRAFT_635350 [Geopyxis carbonaria]|nr:hypothetical protein EDC01DRAFT_635350 [Geopyxis carbonaria]
MARQSTIMITDGVVYADPEQMGPDDTVNSVSSHEYRKSTHSNTDSERQWSTCVSFDLSPRASTRSLRGSPSPDKVHAESEISHMGSHMECKSTESLRRQSIRVEDFDVTTAGPRSSIDAHQSQSQSASQGESSTSRNQHKRQSWPRYRLIDAQLSTTSIVSMPHAPVVPETVSETDEQELDHYSTDERRSTQQTWSTTEQINYTSEYIQHTEESRSNYVEPDHNGPEPQASPALVEPTPEKSPVRKRRFLPLVMERIRSGRVVVRGRALYTKLRKFCPSLRKKRKPDPHETAEAREGLRAVITDTNLESSQEFETAVFTQGHVTLSQNRSEPIVLGPGNIIFGTDDVPEPTLATLIQQDLQNQRDGGSSGTLLQFTVDTIWGYPGAMSQI